MDRGAALNCRVIHNWDEKKLKKRTEETSDEPKIDDES